MANNECTTQEFRLDESGKRYGRMTYDSILKDVLLCVLIRTVCTAKRSIMGQLVLESEFNVFALQ